jgi:hypothetical protein
VLGTLLFYARAIDSTLLTAIGELATRAIAERPQATMEKLAQLLELLRHASRRHRPISQPAT